MGHGTRQTSRVRHHLIAREGSLVLYRGVQVAEQEWDTTFPVAFVHLENQGSRRLPSLCHARDAHGEHPTVSRTVQGRIYGFHQLESQQTYTVRTAKNEVTHKELIVTEDAFCAIPIRSDREEAILAKAERMRNDDLLHSQWALGIITGNNAKKLKTRAAQGLEKIYTGKDIGKYSLKNASRYIKYQRADFQQCAKDEFYRAKEKLVYKFVSSRLCFTYDDKQRLFLNSANILIPEVEGMSMKTVLAFLNSSLFNFLYVKRFGDLKILKGNLMALPFPKITPEQDEQLTVLVDRALLGDKDAPKEIDEMIFSMYQFDNEERDMIINLDYQKP